jgi:protoporphyrinogen oxidase
MNSNVQSGRLIILGAGPTGLGAALRLLEIGESDFVVLEGAESAGGLAGSIVDDGGFTWDLGSHVQHSHYAKFDQYMDLALDTDDWTRHARSAWVWLCDQFVPYPIQLNLHRLPSSARWSEKNRQADSRRGLANFGKSVGLGKRQRAVGRAEGVRELPSAAVLSAHE